MNNLAKPIENKFARSVKHRVQLSCYSQRARGDARRAIKALLIVERQNVFFTHGTVACTGLTLTRTTSEYEERDLMEDRQIYEALHKYPDLSISDILNSRNPIIRALGMLDARTGVARLAKLNVKHEDALVQRLFEFRCQWEGLSIERGPHIVTAIKPPKSTKATDPMTPPVQNRTPEANWNGSCGQCNSCGFHKALRGCNELLQTYPYSTGVNALRDQKEEWIRPIEKWRPHSYSAERQFRALARHLLARYRVPAFMDKAWLRGDDLQREWFKNIGLGENIRKQRGLPLPLTKMMAHYFLTAPEHYSIEGAFRWGQALALGADRRMADAIVHTRLSTSFVDNEFWQGVIEFFARNPMLDPAQVGPIVDYIWNQKYGARSLTGHYGYGEQPNFSMKGRTVNSLLRQVELWHRELGKEHPGPQLEWRKSSIADFEFIEGSAEHNNMRIWRITELLTSSKLADEGTHMRHCVVSYAHSCYSGYNSIWSLAIKTKDRIERLVTIEVRRETMTIIQVRGKFNRLAKLREREIIQRWATRSKLKLS